MIVSEMLSCLVLGVGLGICGGMLGIGGGLIAIPVLSLLFHMDQLLAQGTELIMVTPNVLIGFLRYRQHNQIDLRQTLKLCLIATVSAWFAAQDGIGHTSRQTAKSVCRVFAAACGLLPLAVVRQPPPSGCRCPPAHPLFAPSRYRQRFHVGHFHRRQRTGGGTGAGIAVRL